MIESKMEFGIDGVLKLLPHRYPFLLVDKITDYKPGVYAKGYKNITFNEPFFQGHFPENPIMPGVLQIEAMAQLGAGALKTCPGYENKFVLFAGIDKARFKNIVRPGDKLEMEITILKVKGPVIKSHATAYVDGKLTVEADMLFSMVEKEG